VKIGGVTVTCHWRARAWRHGGTLRNDDDCVLVLRKSARWQPHIAYRCKRILVLASHVCCLIGRLSVSEISL